MKKIIALLFLCSGWAGAVGGYIQSTSSTSASNIASLSAPLTFTAGNTVVVGCTFSSQGVQLSTDSKGDTFAYFGSTITSQSRNVQFMYATNVTGGATTVYCSPSSVTNGDMIVAEYGSSATAGGYDTSSSSATNAGASSTFTSNNATTAQNNESVISYCGFIGNGSLTSTSGNTEVNIDNNNFEVLQDSTVVTAGSYASTGVVNTTLANGFACIQIAFKPSGGGSSTPGSLTFY